MVNVETLLESFRTRFGGDEPTWLVRAPGRVNLIGEHLDYNGGLVLPMAIDLATYAVSARRTDQRVAVFSALAAELIEIDPAQVGPPRTGWGAYVQGIVSELQRVGVQIRGANIMLGGDLPVGAGLSSSAALEVAITLSLLQVSGFTLSWQEIVNICHETEHQWAGVPCGIMDQLICLYARAGELLLIDCQSEGKRRVRWPGDKYTIVIVDSKSPHRLSAGQYAERVSECEMAISNFDWSDFPQQTRSFRDLSKSRLETMVNGMERTLYRRARHVVMEIERVKEAVQAVEAEDFVRLGELMNESHRSLALDYEVSSPRMDALAETVRNVPGVLGARLTGAGFGGCVVAVAEADALARIESAVRARYDPKYGVIAPVWVARPSAGAEVQVL